MIWPGERRDEDRKAKDKSRRGSREGEVFCRPALFSMIIAWVVARLVCGLYFASGPWRLAGIATVCPLFYFILRQYQLKRQRCCLRRETADWLLTLMMAAEAGSSVYQALEELSRQLAGGKGAAAGAWLRLRNGLALQLPVPLVFARLAAELDSPDLQSLGLALEASMESGTDMIEVFRQGAADIRQSLSAEDEIWAYLAQRRLEGTVMSLAPFLFVALLRLLARSYMAPLFNGRGAVLMYFILFLQTAGGYCFFRLLDTRKDGARFLSRAVFQRDLALGLKAGLIPERAWRLALGLYRKKSGRPGLAADSFGRDIGAVSRGIDLGLSFDQALKQAALDGDAVRLAETLRENCRYGSGRLREILRAGAAEGSERILLEIKSGGARKETWLLFPMIIMLISALCVTGGPALLELGGG